MRKIGRLKGLKKLDGCRGYFHDGTQVYDRLGRTVPMDNGVVKVLVDFKWVVVDLGKPKAKHKAKAVVKKSED